MNTSTPSTITTDAHHAFISPLTLSYYFTKRREQRNNLHSLTPSVWKGFIYKGHSSTSYPTGKDYLQYCTFLELSYYIFKVINHAAHDLRSKRAINYRLLCEAANSEPLIITK